MRFFLHSASTAATQGAQYPSIKEYTLNHTIRAPIVVRYIPYLTGIGFSGKCMNPIPCMGVEALGLRVLRLRAFGASYFAAKSKPDVAGLYKVYRV